MPGTVEDMYIASRGSEPMQRVDEVEAVAGGGLRGDRYMERTGYWTDVDECQVTLIEGEALDEIAAATDVRVAHGEHRRNIITRGIRLNDLRGHRFTVGDAVLEYDRPRPPCRYIEGLTQPGMTKALGRGRGGICARVVQSGRIRVGDAIQVLPAGPARRQGA
ncbi:MAG: MOSC domain-containing protein [Chloroflexi bacterium]|nr:MOSC domain-containing protein [Chloroflexota bacterium]MBU1746157.1 MOSC domain-containing protein [Chloroflexota bacterium]MBU1879359.1 MOSC domain-containing protein [Chloroflexota bacterium]